MSSEPPIPQTFRKIEAPDLEIHAFVNGQDECLYIWEFTSHSSYSKFAVTSLIRNIKKEPSKRRNPHEYAHKIKGLRYCARALGELMNIEALAGWTIVPVPPSKAKDDPEYDDRLVRILRYLSPDLDVREIINQITSVEAAHLRAEGSRYSPSELMDMYEIDEGLLDPVPDRIIIFDDMLTAGAHFRAVKNKLLERLPEAEVVGVFIARRVYANEI